jgi:hypothetical protein
MCVIMMIDEKRPSEDMVRRAWNWNCDGGGLAWIKDGHVHWKKGLMGDAGLEEMQKLIASLPMPFVAHFRIASESGGIVTPELTHPFPITRGVELHLEGKTKGYVLFHNGNWGGWIYDAKAAAIASNCKLPKGPLNDTRIIAWMSSLYGSNFLELIDKQKGVVFGPTDYDMITGEGWKEVEGIWCSNNIFTEKQRGPNGTTIYTTNYGSTTTHSSKKYDHRRGFVCRFSYCTSNFLDNGGYCPMHEGGKYQGNGRTESTAGTGGSQPVIPFRLPAGQVISLERAKTLSKTKDQTGKRLLSKSLFKKIQAAYDDWTDGGLGQKRREKAHEKLLEISASLILDGVVL